MNNRLEELEENKEIHCSEQTKQKINELKLLNVGHKIEDFLEDIRREDRNLPTGITEVDEILGGGIKVGGITTIASRTTCGKSTLALKIAINLSEKGEQVIFYTNDDSIEQLFLKGISLVSFELFDKQGAYTVQDIRNYICGRVPMDDKFYHLIEEYKYITKNLRLIDTKDILMESKGADLSNDKSTTYVDDHIEYLRKEIEHYSDVQIKPVIILDYLQNIRVGQGLMEKAQADFAMRELKQLAIGSDLPIILISSISRMHYEKKMCIQALKESGSIEYGSDMIIGIHFADIENNEFSFEKAKKSDVWNMELVLLKNKLGQADKTIPVDFYAKYNSFGSSTKYIKTKINKKLFK